jgi:hypothetical protein
MPGGGWKFFSSTQGVFMWIETGRGVSDHQTDWTIGVLGFDSRRGLGIFLLTTATRTVLRPIQSPIQWVPGALSLGLKRPGREADHSRSSSAEVKECVEQYLHSQYGVFMAWYLVKHSDNFTFISSSLITCDRKDDCFKPQSEI